MSDEAFSQAQRDALKKAWDLLTEHFERVVLVVDTEARDPNDKPCDAHEGYWHGGAMAAIGMAEWAKDRVVNSGERFVEPD